MYQVPINKLYKIWFNSNPEKCLDEENKLRFIKMVNDNPKATVSFLYSEALLSENAVNELNSFCAKHKIQPVSLESFKDQLRHKTEKELFDLINTELECWKKGIGGNPAAASDIARVLVPIIDKLGVYSDFDTPLNFSKLDGVAVDSKHCVILNVCSDIFGSTSVYSDFLAFARDESGNLHPKALDFIDSCQNKMLEAYKKGASNLLDDIIPGVCSVGSNPNNQLLIAFIQEFINSNPNTNGIIEFRRFLQENFNAKFLMEKCLRKSFENTKSIYKFEPGMEKAIEEICDSINGADFRKVSEEWAYEIWKVALKIVDYNSSPKELCETLRKDLFTGSVMCYSGPCTLVKALYSQFVNELQNSNPQVDYSNASKTYTSLLYKFLIEHDTENNGLPSCEPNMHAVNMNAKTSTNPGSTDISWDKVGIQAKEEREKMMHGAAAKIQKNWRGHTAAKKAAQKEKGGI
ncbi:Glycosyltransferase domain protein [Candidatus Cyrtobacter comes]|uniref:Glycosyltransferase domain protein n=1 Tax=Candidatus Cyrtobacter comes TaxID=675776 RepID=A0ABU5L8A4_9RICK|nr:glycosyltransferase family 88 protein [Candidatus Cyrtobacter comes]MDZ5762343.1 Glycosyltransferase domain protein [Candidatus Cyrtobacter comes]